MRIAIVGSGIAGLTAAYLLTQKHHDVHLFESQHRLGMSAQTVEFDSTFDDAEPVLGDVPSRMFNSALWPKVMQLYQSLGMHIASVDAQQTYTLGFTGTPLQFELPFRWKLEIANAASVTLANALGIGAGSSGAFANKRRMEILTEMTRLRDQGRQDLKAIAATMTFSEYLDVHKFSSEFRETFLFPALSSTVCTCSHKAIENYPAVILLDAMQHISGDQRLSRVVDGARSVASALVSGVTKVRLGTPVTSIQRRDGCAFLFTDGQKQRFDHVILATQANAVAGILQDLTTDEANTISGFQYEHVDVLVHSDDRFMPIRKDQWATFNFVASNRRDESMCTVWMNRFHSNWSTDGVSTPVFQTIRPIVDIRADRIIRRVRFQRPIVTPHSWQLWRDLRGFHRQHDRRVWFCGSYAMPGVPLLESGVASAFEVVDAISPPYPSQD